MTGVNGLGVNVNGVNFKAGAGGNNNSNSVKDDKKASNKMPSAKNIALGSLAAIGVLGMADVLLSRGKHINKLTGKSAEFEQTVKNLEERLANSEKKCAETEDKLIEQGKKWDELVTSKEKSQEKTLDFWKDSFASSYQRIYFDALGVREEGNEKMAKTIIKDVKKALHGKGYGVVDTKEMIITKPELFNIQTDKNCEKIEMVSPTIIRRKPKTEEIDKVVEKGVVWVPESLYEFGGNLRSMTKEEQQAIINNPEMWRNML